jgi:hypothetical protein
MHFYMHSYVDKIFILVNSGCYIKEVAVGYGAGHSNWWMTHVVLKVVACTDFSNIGPLDPWIALNACTVTPDQSGIPAEFNGE